MEKPEEVEEMEEDIRMEKRGTMREAVPGSGAGDIGK